MNPRVIAALVLALVLGVVAGVFIGRGLADSEAPDGVPTAGPTTTPVDCAEAVAVVDDANARIGGIVEDEAGQDVNYFAAILAEQRAIAYAMDAAASCFSLADRAGAAGLLAGMERLTQAAANLPGQTPGSPAAPPSTGGSPVTDPPGTEPPSTTGE